MTRPKLKVGDILYRIGKHRLIEEYTIIRVGVKYVYCKRDEPSWETKLQEHRPGCWASVSDFGSEVYFEKKSMAELVIASSSVEEKIRRMPHLWLGALSFKETDVDFLENLLEECLKTIKKAKKGVEDEDKEGSL